MSHTGTCNPTKNSMERLFGINMKGKRPFAPRHLGNKIRREESDVRRIGFFDRHIFAQQPYVSNIFLNGNCSK